MSYLTVKTLGFTAYCNGLIVKNDGRGYGYAHLASLIGTPSHIKALAATVFEGHSLRIFGDLNEDSFIDTQMSFHLPQTNRTRKIGEAVNKILVSHYLGRSKSHMTVFGPDLLIVQERAFRALDAATTVPLKHQWQEWLWEKMNPEKLTSFGGPELQEAYCLTIPSDENLESQILEAIKDGEIK